jgi:S1-C subfamily serine protease
MSNSDNPLQTLSDAMAEAVATASAAILMIDARRRLPASGVAYTSNLVLTAEHVIERDEDIRLFLPDGNELRAQVAGRDPGSDIALLRLEGEQLIPAKTAPDPARVGQLVLALGRPSPEGVQASLGVVSAIGGPVRTRRGGLLEGYLRTDTIPYPGFSGGPLIDVAGRVLGVNTSGLTPGASITIPAALAWKVADALKQHGHVRRGFLGVRSQPVEIPGAAMAALGRQQETGLLLVGVDPGGPAAQAGLIVGDILVALDGEPITDPDQLLARLVGALVGQPIPVQVLRGGKPATMEVTIGERK